MPWTNGIILVAIGVAAIGAFVVAAWVISAACVGPSRRAVAGGEPQPRTNPRLGIPAATARAGRPRCRSVAPQDTAVTRASAIAAGSAWIQRILRLAVNPP